MVWGVCSARRLTRRQLALCVIMGKSGSVGFYIFDKLLVVDKGLGLALLQLFLQDFIFPPLLVI